MATAPVTGKPLIESDRADVLTVSRLKRAGDGDRHGTDLPRCSKLAKQNQDQHDN
jgi:hypothetical protein